MTAEPAAVPGPRGSHMQIPGDLEAPAAPAGVVGLLLFRLLSWVLARQSRTGGTDPPVVPLVLTAGTTGFGEQFWVWLM